MNTQNNEGDLRKLMKEVHLESPGPGFSDRVMNTILAEMQNKPKKFSEPLLGKNFWILVMLFVLLALVLMIFSGNGAVSVDSSSHPFYPGLTLPDLSLFRNTWLVLTEKLESLPMSLAVVTLAVSSLTLFDKLFTARQKFTLG